MDQTSSDRIDEGSLTKGQLRKLNALRKSVGEEVGEPRVRRVAGVTGGGRREGGRQRGVGCRHLVAADRAGPAGDPAQRLPAETRARPDHRRAGAVDRSTVVRGALTPLNLKILAGADPSDAREPVSSPGSRAVLRAARPVGRSPHGTCASRGQPDRRSLPGAQTGHDRGVDDDLHVGGGKPRERQAARHLGMALERAVLLAGDGVDHRVSRRRGRQPPVLRRAGPGAVGARLAPRRAGRPGAASVHWLRARRRA